MAHERLHRLRAADVGKLLTHPERVQYSVSLRVMKHAVDTRQFDPERLRTSLEYIDMRLKRLFDYIQQIGRFRHSMKKTGLPLLMKDREAIDIQIEKVQKHAREAKRYMVLANQLLRNAD